MGHLTGARTKREITQVEIVSDDSLTVLKFSTSDSGVLIQLRDATESEWSAKTFGTLDKEDAEIVSTVLGGGVIGYGSIGSRIEGLTTSGHSLPKPEEIKDPMSGDCTPLDIERAKAANLQEAKQLVQLEMERDHSLDRHITADVPGCPACDRKNPGVAANVEDLPF